MSYLQRCFLFRISQLPSYEAIDSRQSIIDRHARIAIQTVIIVEKYIKGRHDDAYNPKADMRFVLQPYIDQAKDGGKYVKPIVVS